eukprot:TRINITY_DN19278_c0_g1_i2.p1 TRINITY_DN19278_c0_g1~~TRINITY_DN19278_c0_g1_i2.p1  ORF type:complete len:425 (+),score=89.50 TRINITY_DN19278_c0_g1_i2:139-1275(+)
MDKLQGFLKDLQEKRKRRAEAASDAGVSEAKPVHLIRRRIHSKQHEETRNCPAGDAPIPGLGRRRIRMKQAPSLGLPSPSAASRAASAAPALVLPVLSPAPTLGVSEAVVPESEPEAGEGAGASAIAEAMPEAASAAAIPEGAVDIYSSGAAALLSYRPRRPPVRGSLEVLAIPLCRADELLRKSVEAVLHGAWEGDREVRLSVSNLLGLQLNGISLRSGRQTARCQAVAKMSKVGHWLIWEEVPGEAEMPPPEARAVGAMVLRRPRKSEGNNPVVIDYVCADRSRGGRGWPMVLAAEEICRQENTDVLYSAADLTQDGVRTNSAGGCSGQAAVEAHARWGFVTISVEEWQKAGLELYDEKRCRVQYMKKALTPAAAL